MLWAILGPTAAGKSRIALQLALETGAEIISVDSMQVYRQMDIGTAKPTPAEREAVTHHMLDLVDPSTDFQVASFQQQVRHILRHSPQQQILVGGSYLHFRAVVDPLSFPPHDPAIRNRLETQSTQTLVQQLVRIDPEASQHIDLNNPRRVIRALEIYELTGQSPSERSQTTEAQAIKSFQPKIPFVAVGLDPGNSLPILIEERLERMWKQGFLEEVERLAPKMSRTARQAVGYRDLLAVVAGEVSPAEGRKQVFTSTLSLARIQLRRLRGDPRINWIQTEGLDWSAILDQVKTVLEGGAEFVG